MGSQIVQLPSLLLSGVAGSSAPHSTLEKLIPHHTRSFIQRLAHRKVDWTWTNPGSDNQGQFYRHIDIPNVSFPNCWKFKSDFHRVTRKACNKHAIPTDADWKGFKYCFTSKIHMVSSIMWKILWLQSAWLHYCHGMLTFFDSVRYALSFVFFCHLIRWMHGDWPSVEPWRQSPQLHH